MKVPREVEKHARNKVYAENDPYLPPKGKGLVALSICNNCKAVYHNKKWFLDKKLYEEKSKLKDINWVICPRPGPRRGATGRDGDDRPGGGLPGGAGEIMNLIR